MYLVSSTEVSLVALILIVPTYLLVISNEWSDSSTQSASCLNRLLAAASDIGKSNDDDDDDDDDDDGNDDGNDGNDATFTYNNNE